MAPPVKEAKVESKSIEKVAPTVEVKKPEESHVKRAESQPTQVKPSRPKPVDAKEPTKVTVDAPAKAETKPEATSPVKPAVAHAVIVNPGLPTGINSISAQFVSSNPNQNVLQQPTITYQPQFSAYQTLPSNSMPQQQQPQPHMQPMQPMPPIQHIQSVPGQYQTIQAIPVSSPSFVSTAPQPPPNYAQNFYSPLTYYYYNQQQQSQMMPAQPFFNQMPLGAAANTTAQMQPIFLQPASQLQQQVSLQPVMTQCQPMVLMNLQAPAQILPQHNPN